MEALATRVKSCAWCGAALGADAARRRGRIECPGCGAATTDPWPSEEELGEAYQSWYRPEGGRFGPVGDALLRHSRALLARRIDVIAPPGRVLDVGAGEGVLVDALRRRGREAVGLERDSRRADLRDEPLEEIAGEWAAVVFWHSLEHLPDARAAIGDAARLLCRGGVVAIAVPNAASLQARAFGDDWLHLDPPLHLVHLTEQALVDGLTLAGLRVERVSHTRGAQIVIGWLDGLVGRLPGRPGLYQALRRPAARSRPVSPRARAGTIAAAVALLPAAVAAAAVEVAVRRSGTVYVEARRG